MHLNRLLQKSGYTSLLLAVLMPLTLRAEPITEFTTIKELKAQSADLEKADGNESKWFEANSNYGRIFENASNPKLMLSWLGLLSSDYQLADSSARMTRPAAIAYGTYKSNRNDNEPIQMTILVPHPRSMSSRKLNLITEFTDLEKRIKRLEHYEKITVSGFPAELAIDAEKQQCALSIDLPRMSVLFLEAKECEDGKKLVKFCDSIDIFHLAEKLEK